MPVNLTLGVSLKMYFGYQQTREWCQQVAEITRNHPLLKHNDVTLFTFPSQPAIETALTAFAAAPMSVGAQNMSSEPQGAWTGETSARMLQEMGCRFVELGHAERRTHFHEDDAQICQKVCLALQHQLTPVVCIGETTRMAAGQARVFAIEQANTIINALKNKRLQGEIIFAWEPQWAIGASQPASAEYIRTVCSGLRHHLAAAWPRQARVIYGGSAGPGLLTQLWPDVDGLFLGRFAHSPDAFKSILDEAFALSHHSSQKETI